MEGEMGKVLQLAAATALSILSFTVPALAGGSAIGYGIAGFGIGALLGSALGPTTVYVGPPGYYDGPYYYDPYYDPYDDPVDYGPPPPRNWYGGRPYHPPARTNPSHAADKPELVPKHSSTIEAPAYTGSIKQGSEAKLKAAQAKAEKLGGVQKLTSEDVAGLSREQLRKLRGY